MRQGYNIIQHYDTVAKLAEAPSCFGCCCSSSTLVTSHGNTRFDQYRTFLEQVVPEIEALLQRGSAFELAWRVGLTVGRRGGGKLVCASRQPGSWACRQAARRPKEAAATGGRLFVHCEAGVNRSGTLCIAYHAATPWAKQCPFTCLACQHEGGQASQAVYLATGLSVRLIGRLAPISELRFSLLCHRPRSPKPAALSGQVSTGIPLLESARHCKAILLVLCTLLPLLLLLPSLFPRFSASLS